MVTTYEECDKSVATMNAAVMKKYHGDLADAGVTISCLFARNPDGPAVMVHGVPKSAKVKIMSLEDRAAGSADARIVIDEKVWEQLHDDQRRALLDHEQEHLELQLDANNLVKRDDLDRPKMAMRPHDWELTGFANVAQRHKEASIEVKHYLDFAQGEHGQMIMGFAVAKG